VVISTFNWDDDNVEHIQRHDFTPEEVEEVFAGEYKVRRTRPRVITARDMETNEKRLFRRK
jgi:uncharacterized DUF497 family protein